MSNLSLLWKRRKTLLVTSMTLAQGTVTPNESNEVCFSMYRILIATLYFCTQTIIFHFLLRVHLYRVVRLTTFEVLVSTVKEDRCLRLFSGYDTRPEYEGLKFDSLLRHKTFMYSHLALNYGIN